METFTAALLAESDGGHAVVVPQDVRERLGGPARIRVRGTVNGVEFRSNIAQYGGVPYLGIHKATVKQAGLHGGQDLEIRVDIDPDPRSRLKQFQV
jgi:hypothetical protein